MAKLDVIRLETQNSDKIGCEAWIIVTKPGVTFPYKTIRPRKKCAQNYVEIINKKNKALEYKGRLYVRLKI